MQCTGILPAIFLTRKVITIFLDNIKLYTQICLKHPPHTHKKNGCSHITRCLFSRLNASQTPETITGQGGLPNGKNTEPGPSPFYHFCNTFPFLLLNTCEIKM